MCIRDRMKEVRLKLPQSCPESFADDIGVTAKTRRALQPAADIMHEFASLTGQQINALKSFAFTKRAGAKEINPNGEGGAKARLCPGSQMPVELLSGLQHCQWALKVEVFSFNLWLSQPVCTPRSSITLMAERWQALWGPKHRNRCREIVASLLCKGHKLDPAQ
eukprot:8745195-Karenia_brevis.AAC.1